MARVPDPVPGLIFRYGYLWLEEFRKQRTDPAKDRPACIAMQVVGSQNPNLPVAGSAALAPGDVIIFPITIQPPRFGDIAIELSADEKRLCRLDPASPSWLIVSEFNADSWPNPDLSLIPGTNEIAYGLASPGLMKRIARKFAEARQRGTVLGVKRFGG